jgi:hypothetical protein
VEIAIRVRDIGKSQIRNGHFKTRFFLGRYQDDANVLQEVVQGQNGAQMLARRESQDYHVWFRVRLDQPLFERGHLLQKFNLVRLGGLLDDFQQALAQAFFPRTIV